MSRKLSCGIEFMRGLLLFFNVLFVIVGLALIGLGVYIKVDDNFASILNDISKSSEFESQSLGFLAFVMIGGGVVTLLIALFGCMGALWHNRCLLYIYGIILALLMILELVAFIMAFAFKGNLKEVYETSLAKALETSLKGNTTNVLNAFHHLEEQMKCCGVHNITDYYGYPNSSLSTRCKEHRESQGCSETIIAFLNKHLPIIGGSLGGVLLLELCGLISAIALAVAVRHAPSESDSKMLFKGQRYK